jgi:lipopolysaccharide export system permease protein
MPVGAMIGTLFTLSTLNKNNELVALFSLGHSLARISVPILVLVGLLCGFTLWMGDRLVPVFSQKKSYTWYVEMRKRPGMYSTIKQNKIWYRSDNTIFNIQSLNAEQGTAQGITLYYFDEAWNLVQLIRAKTVTMKDQIWNLEDGVVTLFASEASFPLTKPFGSKTLKMSEDLADIRAAAPNSDALSLGELRRFIKRNKEAGLESLKLEVDYHSKIAFAFAGLVLSLIGIPFTVQRARSGGNMMSLGFAISFAFIYWLGFSFSLSLGKHGVLPPFLAAWTPNVLMGAVATYLLMKLKR